LRPITARKLACQALQTYVIDDKSSHVQLHRTKLRFSFIIFELVFGSCMLRGRRWRVDEISIS
jgi:hypothetical protein